MRDLKTISLSLLALFSLIVAILAGLNAVTVAWLSGFPDRLSGLESLRCKFQVSGVISAAALGIAIWTSALLYRRFSQ